MVTGVRPATRVRPARVKMAKVDGMTVVEHMAEAMAPTITAAQAAVGITAVINRAEATMPEVVTAVATMAVGALAVAEAAGATRTGSVDATTIRT